MEEDSGPQCPLCSTSPCTLGHLLSSCKEALDRFEWRHNNIFHYLYSTLSSQRLDGVEVYADLEGLRVNGVTIPPDLAVSAQKPDLVIVKRKSKEVKLVELTVPWDSSNNMAAAVQRKTDRYQGLSTEIMGNGYKCDNNHLHTISKMMGTLVHVQLYTFSYIKPVIRPQNMPKTADWR